ncbi:sucrase ferredoxin [Propioniciclava soli]|uniref:Sucrase ferredoxin n=1 Tax=Propioniciclava soli TaxID=2775081 RepID=A0ABZ3CA61_9ACTN|nr:sucrase ferredoxin [Propioniciclava soli]
MTACSIAWEGLPAFGTATVAQFWVALEQPGPWGREALTESHLDPALGRAVGDEAAAAGGRVLLMRAPGHHAVEEGFASRRVFVAGGLAGDPWLLEGVALAPDAVLRLPWDDLAVGDRDAVLAACPWLRPARHPVLLVCTNSKRDVCCALRGRPVVQDVTARYPGQVWECSHTGGHRFAPTGVVLPLGQLLARLTPGLAAQVLDAAASGQLAAAALTPAHDRGRSHLPPAWQAAESWVRAEAGITDPAALWCEPDPEEHTVVVRHVDGRGWAVRVRPREGGPLPDSCGKAPKPSAWFAVEPRG